MGFSFVGTSLIFSSFANLTDASVILFTTFSFKAGDLFKDSFVSIVLGCSVTCSFDFTISFTLFVSTILLSVFNDSPIIVSFFLTSRLSPVTL